MNFIAKRPIASLSELNVEYYFLRETELQIICLKYQEGWFHTFSLIFIKSSLRRMLSHSLHMQHCWGYCWALADYLAREMTFPIMPACWRAACWIIIDFCTSLVTVLVIWLLIIPSLVIYVNITFTQTHPGIWNKSIRIQASLGIYNNYLHFGSGLVLKDQFKRS